MVTYNSLVDCAVRVRDWDAAMGLLNEMRARQLGADLITYSTLIKGLSAEGLQA